MPPGNAGSFTASDHLLVLTAAFAQIPAARRDDVLVTIDGTGASHEVIDYLSGLNTARAHGRRGRRVEYSVGWPVDTRTMTAIGAFQGSFEARLAGLADGFSSSLVFVVGGVDVPDAGV